MIQLYPKTKKLPRTGALKHLLHSPMDVLSQLNLGWLLGGKEFSIILSDKNMIPNTLCCLLKAGLDVSNSHCRWGDKCE